MSFQPLEIDETTIEQSGQSVIAQTFPHPEHPNGRTHSVFLNSVNPIIWTLEKFEFPTEQAAESTAIEIRHIYSGKYLRAV